jgi:hypothetical protein
LKDCIKAIGQNQQNAHPQHFDQIKSTFETCKLWPLSANENTNHLKNEPNAIEDGPSSPVDDVEEETEEEKNLKNTSSKKSQVIIKKSRAAEPPAAGKPKKNAQLVTDGDDDSTDDEDDVSYKPNCKQQKLDVLHARPAKSKNSDVAEQVQISKGDQSHQNQAAPVNDLSKELRKEANETTKKDASNSDTEEEVEKTCELSEKLSASERKMIINILYNIFKDK